MPPNAAKCRTYDDTHRHIHDIAAHGESFKFLKHVDCSLEIGVASGDQYRVRLTKIGVAVYPL